MKDRFEEEKGVDELLRCDVVEDKKGSTRLNGAERLLERGDLGVAAA